MGAEIFGFLGANVNVANKREDTLLILALKNGHADIDKLLIKKWCRYSCY